MDDIINKTLDYVYEYFSNDYSGHDFYHTLRVYNLAKTIAEKEGGDMLKYGAEHRMGTPEELGYAIATVADERNGYLAGVDILVDGGCTTLKKL